MKKLIPTSLPLLLFLTFAHGEDLAKPWTSVSFKVVHEESAAAVSLQTEDSLTTVNLSIIGTSMDIPKEELEGIDKPDLSTAQLYFGEDYYGEWKEGEEPIPHYVIELTYGEKSKFGNQPTVRFLFHSGKYQQRVTSIQETETVWKLFTKLPGEEPEETGTATRAPHRPPAPGEMPEAGQ